MQILSFDSSNVDVQIALLQDGNPVYEERIPPTQSNRQESASVLLPQIDLALKKLSWSKQDLDLIVVGVGPGSFTGVRVSVVTARSIAQGLGLGLAGVSNLEMIAYASARPTAIVLQAGGGMYYAAAYEDDLCAKQGGELMAPVCAPISELRSSISALEKLQNLVIDPAIPPEVQELLLQNGKSLLPYPDKANAAADAGRLIYERICAEQDSEHGLAPFGAKLNRTSLSKAYPWDNVLPLYLRSPSVTLKANGSPTKANGSSDKTSNRG